MKGHGNLDQSLKKLFVFWRCGAPDVFERFVGVEKFGFVEKANSVQVRIGIHPSLWHRRVGSQHGDVASYVSTIVYRPKIT